MEGGRLRQSSRHAYAAGAVGASAAFGDWVVGPAFAPVFEVMMAGATAGIAAHAAWSVARTYDCTLSTRQLLRAAVLDGAIPSGTAASMMRAIAGGRWGAATLCNAARWVGRRAVAAIAGGAACAAVAVCCPHARAALRVGAALRSGGEGWLLVRAVETAAIRACAQASALQESAPAAALGLARVAA